MFFKILCIALITLVQSYDLSESSDVVDVSALVGSPKWIGSIAAEIAQEFLPRGSSQLARHRRFTFDDFKEWINKIGEKIAEAWADFVLGPGSPCDGLFEKVDKWDRK